MPRRLCIFLSSICISLRIFKSSAPNGSSGDTYTKKIKLTKAEIDKKVKKALEIVDLEGFEKRSVSTLSGGKIKTAHFKAVL